MSSFPNRTPTLGLNYGSQAAENFNWSKLDEVIAALQAKVQALQPPTWAQVNPGPGWPLAGQFFLGFENLMLNFVDQNGIDRKAQIQPLVPPFTVTIKDAATQATIVAVSVTGPPMDFPPPDAIGWFCSTPSAYPANNQSCILVFG